MEDGTRISYLDSAPDGPVVVMLHGLAGSGRELIPTAQALTGHRVVLIDQRGHGHSTRRPADLSRGAFVRDCVRVVESLGCGAVTLVGQSMGAHTAMLTAAARPDLVERLVLLEGNEGGSDPREPQRIGDFFRSWPVPFEDRAAARAVLGDRPLQRAWVEDLEQRSDGLHPRFDPDIMVAAVTATVTPRREAWQQVTAPTLVVYADEGMFTEPEKARFVAAGHDVTRVDLPGASHDAHLDATDAWAAALREFLGTG